MQDSHFVLSIWRLSLLILGVILWYTIWLNLCYLFGVSFIRGSLYSIANTV